METKVTLGGAEYTVAPLKALEVAEFMDLIATDVGSTSNVAIIKRSMGVIVRCLVNAKSPFVADLDVEKIVEKLNDTASWDEINTAFPIALKVSGLTKSEPGEAPATESTSSESSVALSAS